MCDIEKRLRDGAENMECFKVISLSYVLPLVLSSKGGWMQFIIVVRFLDRQSPSISRHNRIGLLITFDFLLRFPGNIGGNIDGAYVKVFFKLVYRFIHMHA